MFYDDARYIQDMLINKQNSDYESVSEDNSTEMNLGNDLFPRLFRVQNIRQI